MIKFSDKNTKKREPDVRLPLCARKKAGRISTCDEKEILMRHHLMGNIMSVHFCRVVGRPMLDFPQ